MKRVALHSLFWIIYFAFLVITEFAWVKFSYPFKDDTVILLSAIKACSVTILPQILFTYYISYVTLVKIVVEKSRFSWYIFEILFLFLLTVAITQLLAHRVVGVYIYGITDVSPLYQLTQFLSFIIYTGFVSGIMVTVKYIKQQLRTAKREQALIKEKLTTELQMLRNQLNPHFLFNTLNNIYALSRKQSVQTPEAIMKLSELLSFMLYESGKDTIPVKKEIGFIDDYISLEKIRYGSRLKLSFTKEVDNEDQQVAPLLLLPLVENAFKHGASQSRNESFIEVKLSVKTGILLFSVRNNYEAWGPELKSSHIGLNSTKRQLELLYKEQSLQLFTSDAIFYIELRINLNSYGTL
jgi:two-component system, LytTR family, sensor kinase